MTDERNHPPHVLRALGRLPAEEPPRREFTDFDSWSGADIILHPDGSLTIETQAEYGDTEMGWGSASATIKMTADQVAAFRAFLRGR